MRCRKIRESTDGQRIFTCLQDHKFEHIGLKAAHEILRYARRASLEDGRQPIDIAISFIEGHRGDLQAFKTNISAKSKQLDRDRNSMHKKQMNQVLVQLENRRMFIDENVRRIVRKNLVKERRNAKANQIDITYNLLSDHRLSTVLAKVLKELGSNDADLDTSASLSTNDKRSSEEDRQLLEDAEEVSSADRAENLVPDVTIDEHDHIVKSIPRPTTKGAKVDVASSSQIPEHEHREHDFWRPNFENQRHEDAQVEQVLSKLRSYGIAINQTIIQDARIMMQDELRLASRASSMDKLSPDQQVLRIAATIRENFAYPRTMSDANRANLTNSSTIGHAATSPSVASPNQHTMTRTLPTAGHALGQLQREDSKETRLDVLNDAASNILSGSSSRSSVSELQQKERVAASYSPSYKSFHWIHISAEHIESEVDDDYIPEERESPSLRGTKNNALRLAERVSAGDNQELLESDVEVARNPTAAVQHSFHTHKLSNQEGTQRTVANVLTKTVKDSMGRSEDLLYPVYDQSLMPPNFVTFISDFRRINSVKTWINRSTITSCWKELLMTKFFYSHIQARAKVEEEVCDYLKTEAQVFGGWLFPRIDVEDGLNIGNVDAYHCAFQEEFLILNPLSRHRPPKDAWATFKTFNKDRVRDHGLLTNVPQRIDNDSSDIPDPHKPHFEKSLFNRSQDHNNCGTLQNNRSGLLETSQFEHSGSSSLEQVTGHYSKESRAMRQMGRLQTKVSIKNEPVDLGMEDALPQHSRAQGSESASTLFESSLPMHEKLSRPSGKKRKRTEEKDVEDWHQTSLVDNSSSEISPKKKTKVKKQEEKIMNRGSSIALPKVSDAAKKNQKRALSTSSESTPFNTPEIRRPPSPSKWSHVPVPKTLHFAKFQATTSKTAAAKELQKVKPVTSTKCPPCPKGADENSDEPTDSSDNGSEESHEDFFTKRDKSLRDNLPESIIKIEDDSDQYSSSDESDIESESEDDDSSDTSESKSESDSDNSSIKMLFNKGKARKSGEKATKISGSKAAVARTKTTTQKAVQKPAAKKYIAKKDTSSKVEKAIKKPIKNEVEKEEKPESAVIEKMKKRKVVEEHAEVEMQPVQLSHMIEARNEIERQISEYLKNQSPANSSQAQAGAQSSPLSSGRKTKKAMGAKETKSKSSRKSSG